MSIIDDLKSRARDWANTVVELVNTPVPPQLQPEKDRLLSYARTVKSAIEKVFPSFDEIAPIDEAVGLGFVPIVAGAAIAVAAAAIAKWTYDYKKFKIKLTEYNKLIESGHTAESASGIVKSLDRGSSLINFDGSKIIPLLLVGGLGYYLWSNR